MILMLHLMLYLPTIRPQIFHNYKVLILIKLQLKRYFKGDGVRLLGAVIDAYVGETCDGKEKGLPIGSLTSQHFANHYLNTIDRWSLSQTGIKAHCRYMDDFVFFLFVGCFYYDQQQNQDPQRVSKQSQLGKLQRLECNAGTLMDTFPPKAWQQVAESLLSGCSFLMGRCFYVY